MTVGRDRTSLELLGRINVPGAERRETRKLSYPTDNGCSVYCKLSLSRMYTGGGDDCYLTIAEICGRLKG